MKDKPKPKIKSKRSDGLGHWPAGKPRNIAPDRWPAVQRRLARLLRNVDYGRSEIAMADRRSRHGLAAALGVNEKSVRRWLDGDRNPTADTVDAIEAWMTKFRR